LVFDDHLACWLASHADVVEAIFESPNFVVRPPKEKVPKNIVGTCAGDVFADLVRMNEGPEHTQGKSVLKTSLRAIDFSLLPQTMEWISAELATQFSLDDGNNLSQWTMNFPAHVVASLIGFPRKELPQVANLLSDFVFCLSPLSAPVQLEAASIAARNLQQRFGELLQTAKADEASFLAKLQTEANNIGWNNTAALASNLIGLLSQTYEASAGLIGNSLVQLHSRGDLLASLIEQPDTMAAFIEEVGRFDPSVQNTRRFVVEDCTIAGRNLLAGDTILLLIAAANRDPQLNADPALFQIDRADRRLFTFSHGRHACPGQALACQIAAHAVQYLCKELTATDSVDLTWHYRVSLNGRIPVFTHASEKRKQHDSRYF